MAITDEYTPPSNQPAYQATDEPQMSAPKLAEPATAEAGADNRGQPAQVKQNGEVVGSGASTGGKGGPEDFDTDPQAGGGTFMIKHEDGKPNEGGDASQHNSA